VAALRLLVVEGFLRSGFSALPPPEGSWNSSRWQTTKKKRGCCLPTQPRYLAISAQAVASWHSPVQSTLPPPACRDASSGDRNAPKSSLAVRLCSCMKIFAGQVILLQPCSPAIALLSIWRRNIPYLTSGIVISQYLNYRCLYPRPDPQPHQENGNAGRTIRRSQERGKQSLRRPRLAHRSRLLHKGDRAEQQGTDLLLKSSSGLSAFRKPPNLAY